jgi:serine/threonine-protein kinase
MLDAPEVVRLLDYGEFADGAPFLVMEKLDGRDLASVLRERRRLSGPAVTRLIREVGRGLAVAWDLGIVHRDIKPQNLFRHEGETATWKILDFGVSKLATTHGTLTQGHVVGTPGYMAPEQARGEDVDYTADLYALAVIAYRSLTGRPAFSGKDVPTTMYEVVYGMPGRPSDMADLDPDIDLALAVGMAKSPADRFASPEALASAIEKALVGELPERIRIRGAKLLGVNPWKEL